MSADDEGVWAPEARADVELTDVKLRPLRPEVTDEPTEIVPGSNRPVVIVLGIVVGLALVGLVVASLGGPDDVEPQPAAPPEAEGVASGPSELSVEQSAALLDAHPSTGDYLLFFRSGDSLALVNFRDGSSRLMDWGVPDQVETEGFLHMASERGSWVVDPDDLSVALRLAPTSQIGVLKNPTRTAVLAESSGATTVFGGFFDGRSVRILAAVPVGSHAEVVQKLGVIISPLSGGSYLIQESSPELVSDGRIVSANENWFGEVLCDERLHCTGNLRSWDDDAVIELPLDVLTSPVVRISPDGRWVLTGGGERYSIYDVAQETSASTGGDVVPNESATWSPDSSFFVWIEARSLFVAGPDRPLERVDLALNVDSLPRLLTTEIGFMPLSDTE